MTEFVFEVEDYRGISVKLSQSVWQNKILSASPIGHPEVAPYADALPKMIRRPDVVFQSTRRKDTHLFYKLRADNDGHHIVVVVKYVMEDNIETGYVSTIYLTNKLYARGDVLWTLQPVEPS